MPLAERTGSEVVLFNLICHAAGKGWDVGVACAREGPLIRELPSSIPVFVHERWNRGRRKYEGLVRRALQEKETFFSSTHRTFKPDVWYINTIAQPEIVRLAQAKHIPCVLHTHEMEHMLRDASAGEIESMTTYPELVIAGSQTARQVFTTLGRTKNIEVCYGAIDPAKVKWDAESRQALRRSLGVSDETFIWAMAGTLQPNKNPARFVALAAEMLSRGNDVHFLWIGGKDSGYSFFVKKLPTELSIADRVTFLGQQTDDYYNWLNAADGLVITSFRESFSIVAVEAAYLGKPIVSFDCGGVKEVLRDGMGVVIDSWNNSDLVAAMEGVMSGRIPVDHQVSRDRVKEFFIEVQGERWEGFMREYFGA